MHSLLNPHKCVFQYLTRIHTFDLFVQIPQGNPIECIFVAKYLQSQSEFDRETKHCHSVKTGVWGSRGRNDPHRRDAPIRTNGPAAVMSVEGKTSKSADDLADKAQNARDRLDLAAELL